MFDCPEQIHTSPTSTSDSVTLFFPSTVIVYGPNDQRQRQRRFPIAIGVGDGFADGRFPLLGRTAFEAN